MPISKPRRGIAPICDPSFVEYAPGHPLVDFVFVFRGGSASDPPGKEGRLALTARTLLRGSRSRSAAAFESEVDRLGAEIDVEVEPDVMRIHATVLARNAEGLFALLADALLEPRFSARETLRQRKAMIADIVDRRNEDDDLASRAFCRVLFANHPYGRPAYGTEKSLARLDRDDLLAARSAILGRANLRIGSAGALDADALAKLVDRYLSGLHDGEPASPFPQSSRSIRGRTMLLIDKPARTRHAVVMGGLGTDVHDPDHFALLVANAVFGGMFTSRLSTELRVRRGWSYDVHSSLSRGRSRQSFAISVMPSSGDLSGTLGLATALLERWIEEGVTDREVSLAKRFLMHGYAFEIDTAVKRLENLLSAWLWDVPFTYYTDFIERVGAVTARDASDAVRRRISSNDVLYALVATASEHRKGIERAVPNLDGVFVHPYGDDIPIGGLEAWSRDG